MKTTMTFSEKFNCVREEIVADLGGGYEAVACLDHESVTTPEDFSDQDCYSAEELAAYDRGEWHYGTVTLTVRFRGQRIKLAGCIGGIEIRPDEDRGFDAANEAAAELLEECDAKKIVRDFAKKAAAAAKKVK